MRLAKVASGHRLPFRVFLGFIRLVSGRAAPDVVKTLYYRPELFGWRFCELLQDVMRRPSFWSAGDRELMAALTSQLNQCLF